MSLVTLSGKSVKTESLKGNSISSISPNGLSKGVYVLQVKGSGADFIRSFIKK